MTNSTHEKLPTDTTGTDKAGSNTGTNSDGAPGDLSRYVFANPQDFLKTLAADTKKMEGWFSADISKDDLLKFAANPKEDTKSRAAARLAANHYDDLTKMADASGEGYGFNTDSANVLLDLDTGKLGTMKTEAIAIDTIGAGLGAVGTVALGAATVIGSEFWPASVLLGGMTVAMGGVTGYLAKNAFGESARIDALAKADQTALSGWSQLGGRS